MIKNFFGKIKNFYKKRKKTSIFLLIVLIAIILIFAFKGSGQPSYETFNVKRGDLVQEVSVTGRIKPVENADLSFEQSGRISQISVKVGDRVEAGQVLMSLANQEISAQVLQSQANYEAEKARLSEMKKGTRPEELQAAETGVANARRSLSDAEAALTSAKNKAAADLYSAYNSALVAAQKGTNAGKSSLITLTDIQFKYFLGNDGDSRILSDKKSAAVKILLGSDGGGYSPSSYIATLSGGAFGMVQSALTNPDFNSIEKALNETISGLQRTSEALNAVPVTTSLSATEKSELAGEKVSVDAELNSCSARQQSVSVQKAANDSIISAAEASVNSAKNALAVAEDSLVLKKAGYTQEQIAAQEARAKSAQASVLSMEAQLAKTIMRSPISGLITKQDHKIGELVSPNVLAVSIISDKKFQIEANIAEADLSKISLNDFAKITLDAYGDLQIFKAKVAMIDPAETLVEGVATYKTTLVFDQEDERIKSGMTANIDILTDSRSNVVFVPYRAIMEKNGEKIINVLKDKKIEERKIEVGMKSSDGNMEIISGLNENEIVVVSFNKINSK